MKLCDALYGIKAELLGVNDNTEIIGITHDSRKVKPGMLFAALPGADSGIHGMTYAEKALAAGAVAVLCDTGDHGDIPVVKVLSSEQAYSLVAANLEGRPAEKLKLIGVTGTNGKTTSCFILKSILDGMGHKTGLIGTVKNIVGNKEYPAALTTPDCYELFGLYKEMVEAGCEYCVMEVSSQALDQHRVDGVHFEAAIFTNLTRDHLDFHQTMEEYTAANYWPMPTYGDLLFGI